MSEKVLSAREKIERQKKLRVIEEKKFVKYRESLALLHKYPTFLEKLQKLALEKKDPTLLAAEEIKEDKEIKKKLDERLSEILSYRGNLRKNQGYTYISRIGNKQIAVNSIKRPNYKDHFYILDGSSMKGGGINPQGDMLNTLLKSAGQISNIVSKSALILDTLNKIKNVGNLALTAYGSKPATIAKNALISFDKNPNANYGFPGEKHIPLPTKFGLSLANFCGPHTQLQKRLERGDLGVDGFNGIDAQCKIHDIDYRDATSIKDIRKADQKLIKNVEKSTGSKTVKSMIKGLIKTKMLGENIGIIDPLEITDFQNIKGAGKKSVYKNNIQISKDLRDKMVLKKLKPSKNKTYPGYNLERKLLKEYKKGKIKNKVKKAIRKLYKI